MTILGSIGVNPSRIGKFGGAKPTYAITQSTTSLNELGSVTFTLTTTGLPRYSAVAYTITGINNSDLSSGSVTGSFYVGNQTWNGTTTEATDQITLTFTEDATSEGAETFTLALDNGEATSSTITVTDSSQNSGYTITANTTSVNEGGTVQFDVTSTNLTSGTVLYYTIEGVSGTLNANDFSTTPSFPGTGGSLSGNVTVTSNTGTFKIYISQDATTEGSETFNVKLRTSSSTGNVVATSQTITIGDTSLDATYSVTPSTTSVSEGGSLSFTVNTTNVPNGTTLYWTVNAVSGSVGSGDFASSTAFPATGGSSSGSFTVTASGTSGSATVTLYIAADALTEGTETFQFKVRTGSTSGTVVATSSTITISDTSVNRTLTISASSSPQSEGATITFTLTSTDIPQGTHFYYTIQNPSGYSGFDSSDLSSGSLTGDFVVGSTTWNASTRVGTSQISITLASDAYYEPNEALQCVLPYSWDSALLTATPPIILISNLSAYYYYIGDTATTGGYSYGASGGSTAYAGNSSVAGMNTLLGDTGFANPFVAGSTSAGYANILGGGTGGGCNTGAQTVGYMYNGTKSSTAPTTNAGNPAGVGYGGFGQSGSSAIGSTGSGGGGGGAHFSSNYDHYSGGNGGSGMIILKMALGYNTTSYWDFSIDGTYYLKTFSSYSYIFIQGSGFVTAKTTTAINVIATLIGGGGGGGESWNTLNPTSGGGGAAGRWYAITFSGATVTKNVSGFINQFYVATGAGGGSNSRGGNTYLDYRYYGNGYSSGSYSAQGGAPGGWWGNSSSGASDVSADTWNAGGHNSSGVPMPSFDPNQGISTSNPGTTYTSTSPAYTGQGNAGGAGSYGGGGGGAGYGSAGYTAPADVYVVR